MRPDPRLDTHNLGPDTNVRHLTAAEEDALLASIPRLADPLHIAEDDLVERRRGTGTMGLVPRRRRRGVRPIFVLLALLAGIVLGLWLDHGAEVKAIVRGEIAPAVFRPVNVPAARAEHQEGVAHLQDGTLPSPGAQPRPPIILEPRLTPSPAPRPVVDQPPGELVTPKPIVVLAPTSGAHGPASWYDDPRKAGLYAAAGPALRVGDWRGRTVTVCASTCFAVVLSDFCGCPGGRVIDLSGNAFARLAPLSRGVVQVTVTW